MSHQFKPGDLAMLKSSCAPELVGSVVELVEYLGDEHFVKCASREMVNSARARIWWVAITSGQTFETLDGLRVADGFCAQHRLMPLRGDFAPEQQKSREVSA